MIVGIGIDIIDNRRIKRTLERYGNKFKNRCFSKEEIELSKNKFQEINSFAKKYAAKEACSKALGTGLANGIFWKDIEIFNNSLGKPYIRLNNKALTKLNEISKTKCKIDLSLSDEKHYSIANVIIYKDVEQK
tara:strand:- start:66 stop:464 length:399 start_codon:yes stop_codon:yes gene_type:complete